ncbi:Cytochrome P450 89A2 [Linum perenne]
MLLTLSSAGKARLPPGHASYPVIGNLIWLRRSLSEIEIILRNLHSKMGPTVTLRLGPRLVVFVADRNLAHQALIHNGAVFADRPPPPPLSRITSSNQQNISSSFYGPTWRLLRRNLTSEILHPSRVKCYSHARRVTEDLIGVIEDLIGVIEDLILIEVKEDLIGGRVDRLGGCEEIIRVQILEKIGGTYRSFVLGRKLTEK